MQPKIGFIGLGKVGYTLARLLDKAGYEIVAVYNRRSLRATDLAKAINTHATQSMVELVQQADLIIVAVSDDAIQHIAKQLASLNLSNKAVIHTSGAISFEPLQSLIEQGAMIGSLHPVFPFADFADSEATTHNLQGITFAIEASDTKLQSWLQQVVSALDGQTIMIPAGQKALYHAALVITSNYSVTLYAIAQQLLQSISADTDAINHALHTLLQATVDNIAQKGIPDALTGPLVRADSGTIQSHIHALNDDMLRQTYIRLAQLSLPMVQQRGIDTHTLETILQDSYETLDDS